MAKKKKKVISTKGVKTRKAPHRQYKGRVRQFQIRGGLPEPDIIREELKGYREILMGRADPPLDMGVLTLMEFSDGCFARVCEIEQLILEAMAEGFIDKDSPYHTLRTQEIRSYKEMFKSATELGSRRLTFAQMQEEHERRGLESI